MEFPKGYLEKIKALAADPKKRDETEYAFYLNEARKMTGEKYIALHKRLERAFVGKSMEHLLSSVKMWVHEAEKSANPAMIFNSRFKVYRGEPLKQNPNFKNYNKNI